jgi:hypothetical protein
MKSTIAGLALFVAIVSAPSLHSGQVEAQRQEGSAVSAGTGAAAPITTATAARATQAVVLDGREDDAVWKDAMVIDGFRTFTPVQNGDPRFRTVAKIAYDDKNIYVFTRMYDSHPDSIVNLMSRRDARTNSDWIKVMLDPYHDRRSGFEFAVNPGGVKRDYAIIDDGNEDQSWDAVWDVGTRIDSLGWVAEFKIPLNQLRYANASDHTFGIMIWRDVARHNERYSWPNYDRNSNGIASKFGDVTGINGIASPRRLELSPYSVAQTANVPAGTAGAYDMKSQSRFGADLKYGLTSNLTLDATINPDFGQVEADPSQVNLSGFESFFSERRPFFLEGQGAFSSNINLLYSRRIGRGPQLGGMYYDADNVNNSTIIGAGKLTGRLSNGINLGILNAVTQRETGSLNAQGLGQTIEPQTNYFAGRASKDLRGGASGIGLMATAVNRQTDQFTESYLRKDAYTGSADFRHQFLKRNYELTGYVAGSRVSGSQASILATQTGLGHNYQRPDDDRYVDSSATSLQGYATAVYFNKRAGGRTRGNVGVEMYSPGFEINDLGFQSRVAQKNQWAWFQYQWNTPTRTYRQGNINFNQWSNWSWDNLRTELGGNMNTHWEMPNSMWLHVGAGMNGIGSSLCDDCLRGGPALTIDPSANGWYGIDGDPRNRIVPSFFGHWSVGSGGRSKNFGFDPFVSYRIGSALNGSLGYSYYHGDNARQPNGIYGVVGNDTTHYTIARLQQRQHSVNVRMSYTMTPTLSLEVFGSPFSSHGDYSNWLEVANARAENWNDRYRAYDGGDPGAFDFKQYRSNTVLRWEYRPGSTIYVVWAQERTQAFGGAAARTAPQGLRELVKAHPNNVLLIKGSYWLSM